VKDEADLDVVGSLFQDLDDLTSKGLLQLEVIFRVVHNSKITFQAFQD